MIATLILGLLVAGFAAAVLFRSVRIVPSGSVDIVERLGRYRRTLGSGVSVIVPFVEMVRTRLDTNEQAVSVPPWPLITNDGHKVKADLLVHYRVTDPVAAVYEISDVRMGIEQLVVTTSRSVVGGMDLQQARSARIELRDTLREVFGEIGERWGIQVTYIEVKEIDPENDE